jgi:hypothetical protein
MSAERKAAGQAMRRVFGTAQDVQIIKFWRRRPDRELPLWTIVPERLGVRGGEHGLGLSLILMRPPQVGGLAAVFLPTILCYH